ncbi:TolC family protein [Mucilaginibacter angelicae]|uniref:TolC family protein n=1 Tax=Mucilaginibacter angelicae TaxID=869718 RepID=A0ABV6L1X1_9SPHI
MFQNRVHKSIILILSVLFINNIPATAQLKISLQEAIELAKKNNLQLKQSENDVSVAYQNKRQAKLDVYPNLNAVTGANLNFGRSLDPASYTYVNQQTVSSSTNITTSFVVFQGFQKSNLIKENDYLWESSKSATKKVENDLVLTVVATYLNILALKDQLDAANQQYQLTQQQFEFEKKNYLIGKKVTADLSRVKFQEAKAQLNLTTIQNQLNNQKLELLQLLNLEPGIKVQLISPTDAINQSYKDSVATIYKVAVNSLPEIKQADYARLAATKAIDVAKGGFYPKLIFSASMASDYSRGLQSNLITFDFAPNNFFAQSRRNLYEVLGLNLSIPVFNNSISKINLSKAKLNLRSAELNESIVKSNLYKVINQAYGDADASEKNYETAQKAYESTKETFDVIQKRYKVGLSNSLDLIQAQDDMNTAEYSLIRAKYDMIFKRKILDFYSGKPITY